MTPSEEIYDRAIAELRADVEKAGDTVSSLRKTGDVIELVYYDRSEDEGWRVLFTVQEDGTRSLIGRNRYSL